MDEIQLRNCKISSDKEKTWIQQICMYIEACM